MNRAPLAPAVRLWRWTGAGARHTPRPRPMPQVRLEMGRCIPAWLVRTVAGAVFLTAGILVATGPAQVLLTAALAVGVVTVRTGVFSAIGVAMVVLAYLARQEPQGWLGICPPLLPALLLLCLHLTVYLSRRVQELSPRARVEIVALRAGVLPAGLIQVFAQVLNAVVTGIEVRATLVALAALLGLAVVCWLLVRRIAEYPQ